MEDISLEGRHILIAEDQAMNAEILTDLLELEDMSSEWAENGRLAVELFAGSEERHFDAILMDMRMPDALRELPYEGAKEMLLVDRIEDPDFLRELIGAMLPELPAPKPKAPKRA